MYRLFQRGYFIFPCGDKFLGDKSFKTCSYNGAHYGRIIHFLCVIYFMPARYTACMVMIDILVVIGYVPDDVPLPLSAYDKYQKAA